MLDPITMNGLRKTVYAAVLAFLHTGADASTCTSLANGEFVVASTWDCGCDPTSCDTLIIRHALTAHTDLEFARTVFVIEESGSLVSDRKFELGSTYITIDGELEAPYLRFFDLGELTNNGSVSGSSVITTKNVTYNYGSFYGSDSVVIGWYRQFQNNGSLISNVLYSLGTLNNYATINSNSLFMHLSLFNAGEIVVLGRMTGALFFDNDGTISADSLIIRGSGYSQGTIVCASAFVLGYEGQTGDLVITGSSLLVTEDFHILQDYSLEGSGTVCVSGHSENHGALVGSLDICDATPTMTVPPYLDVNTGTFPWGYTSCTEAVCSTAGLPDRSTEATARFFPSPVVDRLVVELEGVPAGLVDLELYNMLGKQVRVERGLPAIGFTLVRDPGSVGLHLAILRGSDGRVLLTRSILFAP
ncbi:MAG: hypothetical protein R2818_03405 [Flavobacteriales bacterium]